MIEKKLTHPISETGATISLVTSVTDLISPCEPMEGCHPLCEPCTDGGPDCAPDCTCAPCEEESIEHAPDQGKDPIEEDQGCEPNT